MSKRINIDVIRSFFLEEGYKLITNSYSNNRTKLECLCPNEHICHITYSNFQKGRRCKSCSIKERGKKFKLDQDSVFSEILKSGYTINSKEYISCTEKLDLICPNQHNVLVSWRSLKANNFSCRKCFLEKNRGENHPNYKHGMSKEDRFNRNKSKIENNKWKREVLAKCEYCCVICKRPQNSLIGHHLNGYNWDIENRYNPNNGVILCEYHHDLFHDIYGRGDNTRTQYLNFKQDIERQFVEKLYRIYDPD
jgi:hypothetical protein